MRTFHLSILLVCVVGLSGAPLMAGAATYMETGTPYNSHSLTGNAERLNYVSTDATALTTLNGTLGKSAGGLGEGDVYQIYISDPSVFSASTPTGGPNVNGFNTQLFLFNSTGSGFTPGTGIEANDDAPGGLGTASQLTALPNTYAPGYYYLLITGASLDPAVSTNGTLIFPNDGSRTVVSPSNANAVFGGYADNSTEFGQYAIALSGVQFSVAPEPSSVALVALAAGAAGFAVRRRRGRAAATVAVLAAACLLTTATGRAADASDTEALRKQHLFAADGVPKNLGLGLGGMARDCQAMQREQETRRLSGRPMTEAETASKVSAVTGRYGLSQTDKKGRVLVNVYLDGAKPVKKMARKLGNKGLKVIAQLDTYRKGVISAWMPLALAAKVATIDGVRAVQLAPRPYFRAIHPVGQTTSQGQTVLHADAVQDMNINGALINGTGIKVGALSDTFDRYAAGQDPTGVPDTATYDVAKGDLPVVQDVADYTIGVPTDEGRGMLQIVHDIAPGASLAFATAEGTETVFAQNLRILGSPTTVTGLPMTNLNTNAVTNVAGVGCQVVCDDVGYFDEPMFSDGIVAQAIDYVATNYNVSYFSSAGNDGNAGYSADFVNAVAGANTLADAKKFAKDKGVDLDQTTARGGAAIDPALYAGGIQTFGTDVNGNPVVVQNVTIGSIDANLSFQWDDPYDQSAATTVGTGTATIGITTDYNILVFNAAGVYQSSMSGTADNFQTNQPIELPGTALTAGTSFKIMITRAVDTDDPANTTGGPANPPVSTHLRYVAASDGGGFTGDYIGLNNVETYGHNCAANCSGVAAYVYDAIPNVTKDPAHVPTPQVESFSSNGPVKIYFDAQGNRLKTPNLRLQPAFAAVDGVDTSFFPAIPGTVIFPGIIPITPPTVPTLPIDLPVPIVITPTTPQDYDGDNYPNFFGTSAAAPHAAACAALVLQAASAQGLAAPDPKYVRTLFQATTQPTAATPGTDTQPDFCAATGTNGSYTVTLSGAGSVSTSDNTFRIMYTGPTGSAYKLTSMLIDLSHSGLVFDINTTSGHPFTQGDTGTAETGGAGGATLSPVVQANYLPTATLTFSNFVVGDQLTFGVDRDVQGINAYGNGPDLLEGSTFTATLSSTSVIPNPDITIKGTFTNGFSTAYNFKAGYGLINVQAAVNRMLGQ